MAKIVTVGQKVNFFHFLQVVSGGVACNQYFREGLQKVCDDFDCELVCPPPHLCTDNGIMIAW